MKCKFVILLLSFAFGAFAQNNEPLNSAEQMPEFVGGPDKMMQYIRSNLNVPANAFKDSTSNGCRTIVKFIIEADGKVSNEAIARECTSCPECDKEAIRVIGSMPKWNPGKNGGKPVAVRMALPIFFGKILKNAK